MSTPPTVIHPTAYRGYIIIFDKPPVPHRRWDYGWEPEDYDGPEDPAPTGASSSVCEAKRDIDAALDERPSFLSLDEIDAEKLDLPTLVRAECTECDGSGEGSEPGVTCGTCDGSGRCSYVVDICSSCRGEGERWRDSRFYCEDCGGGHLENIREDYEPDFSEAIRRGAA